MSYRRKETSTQQPGSGGDGRRTHGPCPGGPKQHVPPARPQDLAQGWSGRARERRGGVGGGTAQPLTELTAVGRRRAERTCLLAIERDITHFGLARVHVDREPKMDAEAWWRNYPNGLEPAPANAARICGAAGGAPMPAP